MTPGTILFDRNFQFKDGELGEKIFIVLNDGMRGFYVAVKTTSKGRLFGNLHGCQVTERYPNFLLTLGCCILEKRTWVQLDTFFDFVSGGLMEKVVTNQIQRIGILGDELTRELLVCITHAEDLTTAQENEIQFTLKGLHTKSTEDS